MKKVGWGDKGFEKTVYNTSTPQRKILGWSVNLFSAGNAS